MFRLICTILLRRLAAAVPTLLMLSLIVFVVLRLIPADPLAMMLPPNATPADAAVLRHQLGLDRPLPTQFLIWLSHALQGDLGQSMSFQQPVVRLIGSSLPATLELCIAALVISLAISIPGGVFAYAVTNRRAEFPVSLCVVVMQSIPSFLWALLFIAILGVYLPVLPFSGRLGEGMVMPNITGFLMLDLAVKGQFRELGSAISHIVLPAFALAFGFAPLVVRVMRSSLLDQRNESYEQRILWRHMLKNASLPALTMIGVQFGFLFGSALLVEMIFSFPGVGNLMIQAVRSNDLVLIQGIAVVFCVLMLVITACVDTLYVVLNPRLRKAS
jgi:ABC-type dipeptide/oligopeptide/nickel transport system permease component